MMNQPRFRVQIALCALLPVALTAGCRERAVEAGPWYDWHVVRLEVQEVPLVTGRIELRVDTADGETRFATTSTASLLGAQVAETRSLTRIDESGRTVRFESRSGEDARRYLFDPRGYTVEKLAAAGDPSRPLDDWRVTSRQSFAAPVDETGRLAPLYDYFGMLYGLRGLDLRQVGDEARVYVATSDGPVGFVVRVAETRETLRTFHDAGDGSLRELEATELRLRVSPLDPERSSEGFLRMEGETEIWVEADSKTLLEIDGKVPRVPATIRLMLTEMG